MSFYGATDIRFELLVTSLLGFKATSHLVEAYMIYALLNLFSYGFRLPFGSSKVQYKHLPV